MSKTTRTVASMRRCALAVLAAASIGSVAGQAHAQGDFIGFGVTQFGGANQGECDASHLWWTTREVDNLYEVFHGWTNDGLWDAARKKKNKDVDGADFEDPTESSTGWDDRDDIGCDSGDVCFLSTHGNATFGGDPNDSNVRWTMGENSSDCSPESIDMLYGNTASGRVGDTEILIVDACNSGQWGVWIDSNNNTSTGFFDFVNSTSTMSTYLAYHGFSPDRYAFIDEYAEDVYSDGVGTDWLLEAFDEGNMPNNQDTCPVAVVFGSSSSLRDSMFDFGGFADRKDTGTRTSGASYYFLAGCDPDDGSIVDPEGDAAPETPAERPASNLDASELVRLPDLERPAETFDAGALDNERLSRVLLAGQPLVAQGRRTGLDLWESDGYRLQKNADRGQLYFRVKEEKYRPAAPAALDEGALRDEALRVLGEIGLPASEIGNVHSTRLMKETSEQRRHETHAYTTIVDRAFFGIRARGSRAAVVFDLDGSLKHLMVHWQPVAPAGTPGEQWRTRMTPGEIETRAAARLRELGLDHRPAKLRYQYVPVDEKRTDGATVFALKATAFVGIDRATDELQRPVEIDIDLDP